MSLGHYDQIHSPVQTAVKGKVSHLGIYIALLAVIHLYCHEIFPVLFQQIRNIRTEGGETALMVYRFCPIDIDPARQGSCKDLHIDAAAFHAFWRPKTFRVPACSSVIIPSSVLPVHPIPGVGQVH